MRTMHSKITTLAEAVQRLAPLRAEGKTVVLANGCFDLLHVGHLRYLQAAAAEGDLLVVALNSDDSVRRSKGPERPITCQEDRLVLMAGLRCVDLVFVFEEDTVVPVLRALQPDVHAKGTDYGSPERVPEYAVQREHGGRTVLVGDPKDHATRDLVAQIRAARG